MRSIKANFQQVSENPLTWRWANYIIKQDDLGFRLFWRNDFLCTEWRISEHTSLEGAIRRAEHETGRREGEP